MAAVALCTSRFHMPKRMAQEFLPDMLGIDEGEEGSSGLVVRRLDAESVSSRVTVHAQKPHEIDPLG